MARNIATGIDIGTYQVKVVVAEFARGENDTLRHRIVGTGLAESKGLRHGYIINAADVTRSIRAAVAQAEKASNSRIRNAFISVGGVGLDEMRSKGDAVNARADAEISAQDLEKAENDSRLRITSKLVNRHILHTIPLSFKIDGSQVMGRPQGMKGTKLEVENLFITCFEQHLQDLVGAVEDAGIDVIDTMASPIAGSFVTVTKQQKMVGCVLANIGAETVSIVVFEHGTPISLKVFPVGGNAVTNDIALGLKISLDEAEQLKRGAIIGATYPKKKLEDIVAARLSDIFALIEAHLKSLGRHGLLPAGIILTGGGSGTGSIEDIARSTLKLPSRVGVISREEKAQIKDSTWAVAYGLTIWGMTGDDTTTPNEGVGDLFMRMIRKAGRSLKQFLP
jgi:cell division protein FtsA